MKYTNKHRIRMTAREYAEYLQSDHWRNMREYALRRYPMCARCRVNPSTQVHHVRYRQIWNIGSPDLACLCDLCHERIHWAIKYGYLPKNHTVRDVIGLTEEELLKRIAEKRKPSVIDAELAAKINQSSMLQQRLICGIMKMIHPRDFSKWIGIITTSVRLAKINRIVGDEFRRREPRRSLKIPYGKVFRSIPLPW